MPQAPKGQSDRLRKMLYSIRFPRFLAALAIVLHHIAVNLGSLTVTGAAGVDVFFIVTGTVIGLSTKAGESLHRFGISWFIRVVPLYWIATIAIVMVRFGASGTIPNLSDNCIPCF